MKRILLASGMIGLMTVARAASFDDIGDASGVAPQFTVGVSIGGVAAPREGDPTEFTVGANQAYLLVRNLGPAAWSITDIYFDDAEGVEASLAGIAALVDRDSYFTAGSLRLYGDPGVDFTRGASPANLPQGDVLSPPFETSAGLSADSDSPVVASGIEAGEWLGVIVDLVPGHSVAEVEAALNAGTLRIGIQAQAVGSSTQRDSFVSRASSVPDGSATAWLLGAAVLGLEGLRRRQASRR